MRLSNKEIDAIKACVWAVAPDAPIFLFGSRVDDAKRGGDIDLLIQSNKLSLDALLTLKLRLYDALGEQKIDILTPRPDNAAFVRLAMQKGIRL
jgi:predicted nucleotidyltransferase